MVEVRRYIVAFAVFAGACGPQSQEACTLAAARGGKSGDALQERIDTCVRNFPAKRQPDGTYAVFDRTSNLLIRVSGPKLTQDDLLKIKNAELAKARETWFEAYRAQTPPPVNADRAAVPSATQRPK